MKQRVLQTKCHRPENSLCMEHTSGHVMNTVHEFYVLPRRLSDLNYSTFLWHKDRIQRHCESYYRQSRLGGVVVSVLATRPKGHGFKPDQCDVF
jgi:hypothetical protein